MSLPRYTDLVESASHLTAWRPRPWRDVRLKSVLRQVTEKAEKSDWKLALENIESRTGRLLDSSTELEGDGIQFRQGDVLFGKLRPYLAKAFTAPRAGAAVGDFLVLRPQADLHPSFLRYLLVSPPVIDSLTATAEGAKMPRTSWSALSELIAPIPSFREQVAITAFLDRETSKIDALITEQERLIALLQEKRQAVISHVVTKGLNLNVPMKDSGVEWIGLIPAHWSVLTLRQVGSLLKGRGGSKRDASDEGVQCVRYGDLYTTHTYHINSSRGRIPLSVADGYFEIRRGDVLFAASGEDMADIGKSAVNLIAEQAYCGGDLVVLRPSIQLDAHFSGYAFDAHYAKAQKASLGRGTTVKHIYPDELGRVAVAIPPHNEQQAIAAFVSNELERIEVLRANSTQTIALLRERRTALITAAVTGRIDVRGLVETAA